MSNRTLNETAKILIRAKKFLSDIDNWCPEGTGDFNGMDGHRRCALLAITQVIDETECEIHHYTAAHQILADSALEMHRTSVPQVNRKGHEAVMGLYDHAIAKALSR